MTDPCSQPFAFLLQLLEPCIAITGFFTWVYFFSGRGDMYYDGRSEKQKESIWSWINWLNADCYVWGSTDVPLWFVLFVIPLVFAFPLVIVGEAFMRAAYC